MATGNETDARDSAEAELCKQCGLCCNGAFHSFVELTIDEVVLTSKYPLKEHPTKQAFLLPCAMHDGVCTIYEERPTPCREFRCGVLRELRAEEICFDEAVALTEEIKSDFAEVEDRLASRGCAANRATEWQHPVGRMLSFLKSEADGLSPSDNFERNFDLIAFCQRLKRKSERFETRTRNDE